MSPIVGNITLANSYSQPLQNPNERGEREGERERKPSFDAG